MPNNVGTLWKNQPKEGPDVSIEQVRRKVRELQRKSRRSVIVFWLIAIAVAAFYVRTFVITNDVIARVGLGMMTAWCIYASNEMRRSLWPRPLAADAALATCRQHYLQELERKQRHDGLIWPRLLVPLFLSVAVFLTPAVIGVINHPRLWTRMIPFFVLLAVWFVAFRVIRKRKLTELDREIERARNEPPS